MLPISPIARDVRERYQSASDLATDLRGYLLGRAPRTFPDVAPSGTIPLVDGRTGATLGTLPNREGAAVLLTVRDGRVVITDVPSTGR